MRPRLYSGFIRIGAFFAGAGSVVLVTACASPTQPGSREAAAPPGAEREHRRDAQSACEPRSEPGKGHVLLARMVGRWTVKKTFFPQQGEPVVATGECTQKMIQGGRFLESDFIFRDNSGETTGMGIIGFDEASDRFTSVWIDSRSTRFSMRHSEGAFDGEHIALVSDAPQDSSAGRPARRSRTVAQLENGDRRLVHRQWSIAADGTERLVMQLEMERE